MAPMTETDLITEHDAEIPLEELVGHADGEEVLDAEGNGTGERVVYEYDEAGGFAGWHKEVIVDG